MTKVGITACMVKTRDGEVINEVKDLLYVPNEPYQIHSTDTKKALLELELNFYMPLSCQYLNLKLQKMA